MLFFMCCYCGVYPWGLLRPRSTKTAVSRLVQSHSVRRTSVRVAPISFAPAAAETDLRRGFLRGQDRMRSSKEQPPVDLCAKFEERSFAPANETGFQSSAICKKRRDTPGIH